MKINTNHINSSPDIKYNVTEINCVKKKKKLRKLFCYLLKPVFSLKKPQFS